MKTTRVAVLILLIILGMAAVVGAGVALAKNSPVGVNAESLNSQVIMAVERDGEIVLLSTATQGLAEEKVSRTVFGNDHPESERTEFLQYSYRAKLGIDGGDVLIEETGENEFLVTIPDFIFIGHDNEKFKTAVEDGGILSWVTPEIDTADLITKILSEDAMAEQINVNRDVLEDQARAFYTGIITGINNKIDVEFEFLEAEKKLA